MFNVDFKKLALWLTPQWLRQSTFLLLLMAFTWPLRQVYNSFLMFMAAKLYRLNHNGQVCYLEAVLRDAFDSTLRRIYISDFDGRERIYFWPQAENRDVDFSVTQYFWPDADYADSGVDFTIHLPADVVTTGPQMAYLKSLVNEYKLAGKNYNIVRI
jgi:hypothetical protein